MNKLRFFVVFLIALCVQLSYSQNKMTAQAAEKAAFLAKAPPRVQEYYRVFDSLAVTPQDKPAYQKWSVGELKKYASLVYDANDYDPVMKEKINRLKVNTQTKVNENRTDDYDVVREVRNRISDKYAEVIINPYWLTIVVDGIASVPYIDGIMKLTKINIQAKITKVWKGTNVKAGDVLTCYYLTFWGYRGFVQGGTYVVALFPLLGDNNSDVAYALGGPGEVQKSVYPIENNYIIDEDNLFKLGNKVELRTFTNALSTTIGQIMNWRESAQ